MCPCASLSTCPRWKFWVVGEHWNGVIITGMFAGRTQERSAFVLRSAFSTQISVDAHTHTHTHWIPRTWIHPLPLWGKAVRALCEGTQAPHIQWLGRRCMRSPFYHEIKACRRALLVPEHPSKGRRKKKEKQRLHFPPLSVQVFLFTFFAFLLINIQAIVNLLLVHSCWCCLKLNINLIWSLEVRSEALAWRRVTHQYADIISKTSTDGVICKDGHKWKKMPPKVAIICS